MIQKEVIKYIEAHQLFSQNDRLLLAVSGGADSVVLLNLMVNLGYHCEVAHVNFQLRGEASEADAALVYRICANHGLRLHSKSVDTLAYAAEHKLSMEMAAREIRYDFFDEILDNYNLDYVVVAHHRDDVVETFFINLFRGTGLRGLSGIKAKTGKIVRPFLSVSRADILDYISQNQLEYRTDESNFDTNIHRNYIRQVMLPSFEEVKSGFSDVMQRSISRLRNSELLVDAYVKQWTELNVKHEDGVLSINKEQLYNSPSPSEILFQILSPKGFSVAVIDELSFDNQWRVGASFYSEDYRLTVDRSCFIVSRITDNLSHFYIKKEDETLKEPIPMQMTFIENNDEFVLEKRSDIAFIDAEKLEFPLELRSWREGDVFCPIGMDGKQKKVSDYFIDNKFSIYQKENIWLLCSAGQIVWIVGSRLDERFKVNKETRLILKIKL